MAILIRDQLRQQVRDNTAAWPNVTLGYLLDEWLSGHQVEETTRTNYRLLIDLPIMQPATRFFFTVLPPGLEVQ